MEYRLLRNIISAEDLRQRSELSLIASENIISNDVQNALNCQITNKTVEGYPGRRYHAGCANADKLERVAKLKAMRVFSAKYANVQPHSCSQANQAALFASISPGDTILSMSISHGGHISHGLRNSFSGRFFNVVSYGVSRETMLIDYNQVAHLAEKHKPKIIIAGSSSYSRIIDFKILRKISSDCGASLLVDIAHVAGLIAAGIYPNPIDEADIVTTSMYKTLRGPRGGLIMSNNYSLSDALDRAVFPGLQGTPCLNSIYAKAICLSESLQQGFKKYAKLTTTLARQFSNNMISSNIKVVTDGTDCHLVLVDLTSTGITGKKLQDGLESCGILCNMNLLPFDSAPPTVCSGARFGFSVAASIGLNTQSIDELSDIIVSVIHRLKSCGKLSSQLARSIKTNISNNFSLSSRQICK